MGIRGEVGATCQTPMLWLSCTLTFSPNPVTMQLGGHALQVSPAAPSAGSASTVLTEKKAASYPGVGLTTFRKARDVAKLQRAKDSDPIEARKLEKLKGGLDGGFKAVAMDWHGKQVSGWSAGHRTPARCEASIGCIRCSSGLDLRDWKSPNTQPTQDSQPDEHPSALASDH